MTSFFTPLCHPVKAIAQARAPGDRARNRNRARARALLPSVLLPSARFMKCVVSFDNCGLYVLSLSFSLCRLFR